MKGNQLLHEDLSELRKTRFLSTWQLFQKMFVLIVLLTNTITQFTDTN